MEREQRDRDLFNRIAAKYAKKDSTPSSSLPRRNQLMLAFEKVFRLCSLRASVATDSQVGTIVDIGCGVGAPANYLSGHYTRYIGLDHSEEMVKAARQYNQGNAQAEFIAANVKSLTLPDNVADVILSIGALHHMTELDEVMKSLNRIAKPNAFLVVIEPQNNNPLLQAMRWARSQVDSSYSEEQIFFSEASLKELFSRHGITDITLTYEGFFSTPFAQVILPPQALMAPLSRLAISIDNWFHAYAPVTLKKMSFNLLLTGRFPIT